MRYFFILIFYLSSIQVWSQQLSDSIALESFMDGVIMTTLQDKNIAGATLSIVKDSTVILKKGYGYANLEKQLPVDPDKTLFRIGSITKMFVWTSVMRLVSEGKIDLDADVNTYLKDFKIPEKFGQPITMRHLMTHTPGFEDRLLGLFANGQESMKPLGEILKKELPDRVAPPFEYAAYSNHGTGIAACIVEQVSGMSFDDYVEKNFLLPLRMYYTTLKQPIPEHLAEYISEGYKLYDHLEKKGFEYVPLYPVGGASASAADMANLMIAYLNHGSFEGYRMIDSTALASMMQEVKKVHHAVNPMLLGFMDISYNSHKVVGHGGDTFWFHSIMALLPAERVGFFLSFNSDKGAGAYSNVFRSFMDRYYPDTVQLPPIPTWSKEKFSAYTGEYKMTRYPHSDLMKIISLLMRVRVEQVDSVRFKIVSPFETTVYVPVDSITFRKEFSNERFGFEFDEENKVLRAFEGILPILTYERVSLWESSNTHLLIFIVTLVLSLTTIIYWPLVALVRKNYIRGPRAKSPLSYTSKLVAWVNYLFLLLFYLLFSLSLGEQEEIVFGVPGLLKFALFFPFLIIATTIMMLLSLPGVFKHHGYRTRSRLYYLLLCIVSLLALWQLYFWNLIGYQF